jgi:hypothetical protein
MQYPWTSIMAFNHHLAVAAGEMLAEATHTAIQAPAEMIGSMASIRLPAGPWPRAEATRRMEMIDDALRGRRFEAPLMMWPCPWLVDSGDLPPDVEFDLLIRVSAELYNYLGQYERLSSSLAGFAGADRPQARPAPSTVATE